MNVKSEIPALTGLRFVAAFYVFAFHIHIRWHLTDNQFLSNFLSQGAIGMSLFFILSGFILAHRYTGETTSLNAYFVNRAARIYPVYAVAALVTLPWLGVSLEDGTTYGLIQAFAQIILLVIANVLLIQAWFPQFFSYWNDGASWSISVEAFCYVILPLFLLTLVRISISRLLLVTLACYFLTILPGLIGTIFSPATSGLYYSMPIFRAPEFLIGVCSFFIFQKGWHLKLNQYYQLAFLGLVIVYLGVFGPSIPNYVGHNWLVVPFIVFMILNVASGNGIIAILLSSPIVVWLGKISYCFYSFQALVIFLTFSYHDQLVQFVPPFAYNNILMISALLTLLVISTLAYFLIEVPARRWIRSRYAG